MLRGVGHSLECVLAVRVDVLVLWPVDGYAVAKSAVFPIAGQRFTLGAFNGADGLDAFARDIEQAEEHSVAVWRVCLSPMPIDETLHIVRHEVFTTELPARLVYCPVHEAVGAPTLMKALNGGISTGIGLCDVLTTMGWGYAVDAPAGDQHGVDFGKLIGVVDRAGIGEVPQRRVGQGDSIGRVHTVGRVFATPSDLGVLAPRGKTFTS